MVLPHYPRGLRVNERTLGVLKTSTALCHVTMHVGRTPAAVSVYSTVRVVEVGTRRYWGTDVGGCNSWDAAVVCHSGGSRGDVGDEIGLVDKRSASVCNLGQDPSVLRSKLNTRA